MKTSNKLLLGIFLGPLLIFTFLQLTLYAKYKTGHYEVYKTAQAARFEKHAVPAIHSVSLYGLEHITIRPAPGAAYEFEKVAESAATFQVAGDSLIIKAPAKKGTPAGKETSDQYITVYLPSSAKIFSHNSSILLEGSKEDAHAASYEFFLRDGGELRVQEREHDDSSMVYFNGLSIHGTDQNINLSSNAHIASLQLWLTHTDVQDNGATIEKLVIEADKSSVLTLNGENLRKSK